MESSSVACYLVSLLLLPQRCFLKEYIWIEPVSREGLVRSANAVLGGFEGSDVVLSVSADAAGAVGKTG